MKLEEAKEIIENEIDGCDVFSCEMCKRDCTCDNSPCVEEGCQLAIAVDTVFQELEHLQKENEKLKEIDLTTVYIKGVCDEKDRWRNKIREMLEDYKKGVDCTYCNNTCSRYILCTNLQDLLKEE